MMPTGATVEARGTFVEFSFIRRGWTKKRPFSSWFAPHARRCSTFVVLTIEGISIAATSAEAKVGHVRAAVAMPATRQARTGGSIIAIAPVAIEAESVVASTQA
jgi:hypothetical protein